MGQNKMIKARPELETLLHTAEKPLKCYLWIKWEHKKRDNICITLSSTTEYFFMLFWNWQFSPKTNSNMGVKLFNAPPNPDVCSS